MSKIVADRIGSPAVRQSHHLYDVLCHTLATLADTTVGQMPVALIVKACDLSDRATVIARDRWYEKITAPGVTGWCCGPTDDRTTVFYRED